MPLAQPMSILSLQKSLISFLKTLGSAFDFFEGKCSKSNCFLNLSIGHGSVFGVSISVTKGESEMS